MLIKVKSIGPPSLVQLILQWVPRLMFLFKEEKILIKYLGSSTQINVLQKDFYFITELVVQVAGQHRSCRYCSWLTLEERAASDTTTEMDNPNVSFVVISCLLWTKILLLMLMSDLSFDTESTELWHHNGEALPRPSLFQQLSDQEYLNKNVVFLWTTDVL